MPPIAFKPLCLIALLLLAAGLLGCAADTTPAPQSDLPVAGPTAAFSVAPVAPIPRPTATISVAPPAITPRSTAGLPPLPTITPIPTRAPFSIPTPYPTVCYIQKDDLRELLYCGQPALKPTPTYLSLDYSLEHLVLSVEKGWPPLVDAILHGEYKGVEITLWGNLDYIVQWLEVNDAVISTVKPNYISAAVPV